MNNEFRVLLLILEKAWHDVFGDMECDVCLVLVADFGQLHRDASDASISKNGVVQNKFNEMDNHTGAQCLQASRGLAAHCLCTTTQSHQVHRKLARRGSCSRQSRR